jgi:hypothetical protein
LPEPLLDLKRLELGIYPDRFDNVKLPKIKKRVQLKKVTWAEIYEKLPDWSKNRVRFHMNGSTMIEVESDPARTICYGIYREALIASGNQDLIEKYELDQVVQNYDDVRKLSEFMKKKGTQADKRWRYLVDLHRLNDYIKPPPASEFVEDIKDWVQRRPKHTWNGDEEEWYRRYELAVNKVLFRSGKRPGKLMSVDDFIQNGDVWCTSGSGFEPDAGKLEILDRDRNEKEYVKKNKWSVRWGLSNYKVKKLLFKKRRQICKAVPKAEPAKVRAVISSDLSLYLKMTYISTFLDQILAGRTDSTLWMSDADRMKLWEDMAYDGTWRMPLDQSEFDKNVTKRQVLIKVRCIKKLLEAYGATEQMLEIMDLILYALDGGYVIVDGQRIDIENGILSGWRWTALLDTIANLAEVEMAKDWVTENSVIDHGIIEVNAQGDDDKFKIRTRRGAVAIWLAYESFGLGVNPGKFFLDKDRDEYLRRVMDGDKITGYPARSISSIMFRNPINESEPVGAARVRSTFGKWKLFAERLDRNLAEGWFRRKMIQDCVQGTHGLTKQLVEDYVDLGAMYGGIGLDHKGYKEVPLISQSIMENDGIELLGEGYYEWVEFADKYGVTLRDANRFAVSTLDLSGRQGWPSWVKYIYTYDELKTGKEHGLVTGLPGTICIGRRTLNYARRKNLPWFATENAATHMTQFKEEDAGVAHWYNPPLEKIRIPKGRSRPGRVETVDGISMTLAQLSEKYELVWKDWNPAKYDKLPRRWLKDFLAGRLKTKVGPLTGWGMDVVGYYSKYYLNTAINIFLSTNAPTMHLWDSLLASIEVAVRTELEGKKTRIIE